MHKTDRGFTLVELLTVMAIIGILASIVLVSLANARANARDTNRRTDLKTLQGALELYFSKHGSYVVTGYGAGGTGAGVVSQDGAPNTIIQGLYNDGDLSTNTSLPALPTNAGDYYLLYVCGGSYAFSARLENPTASDIADIQTTCNGTGGNGTYTFYNRNTAVHN